MNVAIVHTDFRIYWPVKLKVLSDFLSGKDIHLEIIEVSGRGSPYSFAAQPEWKFDNYVCLFPDDRMEDLSPAKAKGAVLAKLDDLAPDCIISGPIAFPSGAAAIEWSARNRKPVVIFDDARLQDVQRPRLIDWIKKKVYSCASAVLCPARGWIETFSHFGFREDQIFFGVDVVDNDFWSQPAIRNLPIKNIPKYFLAIGRQVPKKNFLSLVKAYWEYFKSAGEPVHLILIGDGPDRVEEEIFVEAHKLESYVHFLSFISQIELRPYYQNATCLILPSIYGESWGLVVNEAMASGLPVLVSNQAGCSDTLVKEGINGYTFSPLNIGELAGLLKKIAGIYDWERILMGTKSREIISEWGLDRFCQGVYDAIQFVSRSEHKNPDLLTKLIVKLWKGRYRPV